MDFPRPDENAIVLVPSARTLVPRQSTSLALQLIRLLPALVATPQRALFTAGITLGLAGPPVLRLVAARALGGALRSLVRVQPVSSHEADEMIIERIVATRVVVRKRKG